MSGEIHVIKVGGNELAESAFVQGLVEAVAALAGPAVLVHGGGQAIADLQQRLGLAPIKVDGLRVTDAPSLAVAEMVLSGQINKRLVAALLAGGVPALGLSGVDGALLRCHPKQHPDVDLGFVGEIVKVNGALLHKLLALRLVPVISPISLGDGGQAYNVNADEAASAVAAALGAATLTFLSNVPAVFDRAGRPLRALTAAECAALVAEGTIAGGMVPKVQAALAGLAGGVRRTRIVDLAGLAGGGGTQFSNSD